jgi:hypothetical protein
MAAIERREAFAPGRLWSLLEMYKFDAGKFYCAAISMLRAQLLANERKGTNPIDYSAPLQDERILSVAMTRAKNLKEAIGSLGARVTEMAVDNQIFALESSYKPNLNELNEQYRDIEGRLEDELSLVCLYSIDNSKRRYIDQSTPLFGSDFEANFKTGGVFELDEAAKCLAFGRPTAAVFHLMRVMEIGIRALARCLAISDPVKPAERNWGKILERIWVELRASGLLFRAGTLATVLFSMSFMCHSMRSKIRGAIRPCMSKRNILMTRPSTSSWR